MFDTHSHINLDVFDTDRHDVIVSARGAGVKQIICAGTDLETSKRCVEISDSYKGVYGACGVHPTEDLEKLDIEAVVTTLEEIIMEEGSVVAVGEIGLDYYKYRAPIRIQKIFFESQIKLASKLGLSVIVHNRHAAEDIINVFLKTWNSALEENVVFHCCEPDEKLLNYAKEKRIFIGVAGDVTYDRKKQEFVKTIPDELIVIETDSPYQTPEPVRSKKRFPNEPKNLIYTVEKVAKLRNIPVENFKKLTTLNANKLFSINI